MEGDFTKVVLVLVLDSVVAMEGTLIPDTLGKIITSFPMPTPYFQTLFVVETSYM
jgi:hypothetical protein